MKLTRRIYFFSLVALLALALGIYLSLKQLDPTPQHPLQGISFNTPDGGSYDMGSLQGQVVVLNFWATWCPPCIEEMPELDELYREKLQPKGIPMIGIAIDTPEKVAEFLVETPVSYPIVMGGFAGTELGKLLGNTQGGLPFTVILDPQGAVKLEKAGRIEMDTIREGLTFGMGS